MPTIHQDMPNTQMEHQFTHAKGWENIRCGVVGWGGLGWGGMDVKLIERGQQRSPGLGSMALVSTSCGLHHSPLN